MTGRRTSALDWLPSAGGPSDDGGEEAHTETGHLIQTHYAYPSGYPNRHERPVGWGYSIWEAQDDMGDGHGPGYECVSEGEDRVFPNHDGAKAAAEEHYYRLNHSKHRPPESRIDYENLINPRDGLDDDFGHIFGRRTAAWADWAKVGSDGDRTDYGEMLSYDPEEVPDAEFHVAKLEDGHELHVTNHLTQGEDGHPFVDHSKGYSWHIWDPYEPDLIDAGGAPSDQHLLSESRKGKTHHIPTLDQAKEEAEAAYVNLARGGLKGLQSHPNNPGINRGVERRDDDGHGRILGSLDMVDLIRLAGDGMSWEDTMAHIDQVLAEGEPEDKSDYSTDYSVNHYDEVDTEEDRLAEQARRNQEEDDLTDRLWGEWMGQLSGKHHRWLEEVDPKAMDHDFAAYRDHRVNGASYTMTPVPQDELHRQQRTINEFYQGVDDPFDPRQFGARRELIARLDTADIIRLAGDGMSWEDTMAHIDRVLAEGEPEDRSDYSTDYYHDGHGEHGVDGDPYDPYDHRVDWDEVPPHPDQDWQQTPDYDTGYVTEQHHKVKDGRHVLVEKDEVRGGWTWSHFNGDPFGAASSPNAWGNLPTREQAFRAAEDALAHTSGEAHTWSDMRHHGHDPMDQGDPLTYEGDPEFANIHHPNYRQYMEQRGLTPRTSRLDMADLVRLAGDGAAGFHEAARTAAGAAPVQDPAAMAPRAPVAGGYQPGHRVGLPWRDQVVRGTVIGVDGPEAIIRWDDGQYSNEEPRNIQLL